ncbi:MAG: hypothetical protein K0S74_839 [Chlamydiales bacterium]|jgi:hypothetical protein|nr:hypothetical protein [Chlamydiales bacterium]
MANLHAFPYEESFMMLGAHILFRGLHRRCVDEVSDFFSPFVIEPWCMPDIIIECDWPEIGRYLFRARPAEDKGPLNGVWVHTHQNLSSEEWNMTDPPFPPFKLAPLSNRFIGLHAAAVQMPDGDCLVIAGHQKAGKTTTALSLVNKYGGSLLTDEVVLIHRRTTIVEPFLRAVYVWNTAVQNSEKILTPANIACQKVSLLPCRMTKLIFLAPNIETTPEQTLTPMQPSDIFQELIQHHLDWGSTKDEAFVTLFQLAKNINAFKFSYQGYEILQDRIPLMLDTYYANK